MRARPGPGPTLEPSPERPQFNTGTIWTVVPSGLGGRRGRSPARVVGDVKAARLPPRGGPQPHRRSRPWRRLEPSSVWTCTPPRSWRRYSTPRPASCSLSRVGGEVGEAAGLCAGLPRPVRAAYEAGPTGYGLARELARRGVSAWSRRRARSRARRAIGSRPTAATPSSSSGLLLAGKLHAVRVPGPAEEALRDLVRAREALRGDLMRAGTGSRSCCCATASALMTARLDRAPPRLAGRGRRSAGRRRRRPRRRDRRRRRARAPPRRARA